MYICGYCHIQDYMYLCIVHGLFLVSGRKTTIKIFNCYCHLWACTRVRSYTGYTHSLSRVGMSGLWRVNGL